MPWNKVNPMDQRLLFLADYVRKRDSVAALCRQYNISRKTAYKWIKRYQEDGLDGLSERISKPFHNPNKTPYRVEQKILELRKKLIITPGPKKIQALLATEFPNTHIPSKTTIHTILTRHGLIDKMARKKRRPIPSFPKPFAPVNENNDLWSVDYKGQFKLGNQKYCYPLTIMEHKTRFLLACDALSGTVFKQTQATFIRLFKEHGMPLRIRSDNGTPFASNSCGGLSNLSIWWIKLGISPERIDPGKPQQNGQHERMHRTLKQSTCKPPAHSLKPQQTRFDNFHQEYNFVRPHEALGQKTPASVYDSSPRAFPDKLIPLHYPDYYDVARVRDNGMIFWGKMEIYISNLLKGEHVGINEIDDGVLCIFFGPVFLGRIEQRHNPRPKNDYYSLKV